MPELPEIAILAKQMKSDLVGKTVTGVEVLQPKCLNMEPDMFAEQVAGAEIRDVAYRGKWILWDTTQGWVLLNLGMGGETLLVTRATLPEKRRAILDFSDGSCLAINFWWFGYLHWAEDPDSHPMVGKLGPNALGLSVEGLCGILRGRRGAVKTILMDQAKIAGIGNVYAQDILFRARLHPLHTANGLTDAEIEALAGAIQESLQQAVGLGGSAWEQDLHGNHGGFGQEHFLVAYREGKPCPVCGTTVEKIRTGSTSGYICPNCQRLP